MPHKSDDLKLTAVRHYLEQSHNYDETSRVFHCPATSLKRWVEHFQRIGTVARQKRDYVSYKVTKQHVSEAISVLKKHPTISMNELSKQIEQTHDDYSITPQWLGRVLRDNKQTRKRTKHRHEPTTHVFANQLTSNKNTKHSIRRLVNSPSMTLFAWTRHQLHHL